MSELELVQKINNTDIGYDDRLCAAFELFAVRFSKQSNIRITYEDVFHHNNYCLGHSLSGGSRHQYDKVENAFKEWLGEDIYNELDNVVNIKIMLNKILQIPEVN